MKKLNGKKKICVWVILGMFVIGLAIHFRASIIYRMHVAYTNLRIALEYDGTNTISNSRYEGNVNCQSRFLSIGFDDFRLSDFSLVESLFSQYDATATYNRIAWEKHLSRCEVSKIDRLENMGNELGDHTWFHCNYIFTDPLINGQDPRMPEGNQKIFPTNDQLRNDGGNGKNAFGYDINEPVNESLPWFNKTPDMESIEENWGGLTDEQCQVIRDSFSIYKDSTGILDTLDELSNQYLGTYGKSRGSWNSKKECYEGGIFTGSKTSCNHEIWERVLKVTELFYQDQYLSEFQFDTWSWPGDPRSPFIFEENDKKYYDEDCTILYNYLAQFPSSINCDERGEPVLRSWTSVLRNAGYRITHDTFYPSREDGVSMPMMSKQLIYNARLSRKDALVYSTNKSVSYDEIANAYPQSFFDDSTGKSYAAQMYDDGGVFYSFIESIRQNTSNGMIHGEVIDSQDTYSERQFLTQMLEYCRQTGVEVVSKQRAYDICFNHRIQDGNLIYNPSFRNTAKEFMPDAEYIPDNPDGYVGDCHVILNDAKENTLVVRGDAEYLHYGIPMGNIAYSANVKGHGEISIYAIRNKDRIELNNVDLKLLCHCKIDNEEVKNINTLFQIEDYSVTKYEQVCEGMGNKIMGIKIVYSGSLEIDHIALECDK